MIVSFVASANFLKSPSTTHKVLASEPNHRRGVLIPNNGGGSEAVAWAQIRWKQETRHYAFAITITSDATTHDNAGVLMTQGEGGYQCLGKIVFLVVVSRLPVTRPSSAHCPAYPAARVWRARAPVMPAFGPAPPPSADRNITRTSSHRSTP